MKHAFITATGGCIMYLSHKEGYYMRGVYLPLIADYANCRDYLFSAEDMEDIPTPEYTGEECGILNAPEENGKHRRHRILEVIHEMEEEHVDLLAYPTFNEVKDVWSKEYVRYKKFWRLLRHIELDKLTKIRDYLRTQY